MKWLLFLQLTETAIECHWHAFWLLFFLTPAHYSPRTCAGEMTTSDESGLKCGTRDASKLHE